MSERTFKCKYCNQTFSQFQGEDLSLPLMNGFHVHVTHLKCPLCNEPQFTITNPNEFTSMQPKGLATQIGELRDEVEQLKSNTEGAS